MPSDFMFRPLRTFGYRFGYLRHGVSADIMTILCPSGKELYECPGSPR